MAHARNGYSQSSRFLPQARRIVGSGDENALRMAVAITTDLGGITNFDIHGDRTTVGARWKKWKRSFKLFVVGKGVQDATQKKALLLHCGGPQMQDVYYTFPEAREPGEGETVYTVAMEQLDQYFMPQVNAPTRDICFGLWLSYLLKASISLSQGFVKGQNIANSAIRSMKIFEGNRKMYVQSSAKETSEKRTDLRAATKYCKIYGS